MDQCSPSEREAASGSLATDVQLLDRPRELLFIGLGRRNVDERTKRSCDPETRHLDDIGRKQGGRARITRDTVGSMTTVTVRELRNKGGEVLDRVLRGDTIVVTRDGHEVAELRPLPPRVLDASALLARWRHIPSVDPVELRRDLDSFLDASL